jgi:hypothetical protein
MLMSDYFTAVAFAATGVVPLVDWAEDDTGVIADYKRDRQREKISMIG